MCSERSGSNFITNLVGGHPDISAPPPTHLFRLFGTNESNYGNLSEDNNWNTLVSDVVENFNSKLGIWNSTISVNELKQKAKRRTSAELLKLIYEKEAKSDNASHIFVKENHTYNIVPYLISSYPDCRFVFMVRDPRDVASSWVSTDTIPGGVEKAVDTWLRDQSESWILYNKMKGDDRIFFIRYEDLITDSVTWIKKLTEFLQIAYCESFLEYYKQPRTIANAERIEAWVNVRKPVLKGNAGKYKSVLKEVDLRYVELCCGSLMKDFGYSLDLFSVGSKTEGLDDEIKDLKARVSLGNYSVENPEEESIRQKRLSAIKQVLNRKL